MWTRWTFKLCVPLASAAVLAGCTQEVGENKNPRTEYGEPNENLRLSVTGCLEAGTGTNQFVLTHVHPAPLAQQPSDALSAANLTIPENSAIRLSTGDEEELAKLTGETVTVTGILEHDGRDTIGTGGRQPVSPSEAEARTDRSQAAATGQHHSDKVKQEAGPIGRQSMNNGTFPEMTVTDVKSSGKKCQ